MKSHSKTGKRHSKRYGKSIANRWQCQSQSQSQGSLLTFVGNSRLLGSSAFGPVCVLNSRLERARGGGRP